MPEPEQTEPQTVSADEVLNELVQSGLVSNASVQLAANLVGMRNQNQELQARLHERETDKEKPE